VRELDWTKPSQLQQYAQLYDYIVGTDCVYHEALVLDLLRVVLHCCSLKTHGAQLLLLCALPAEDGIAGGCVWLCRFSCACAGPDCMAGCHVLVALLTSVQLRCSAGTCDAI
jgi:hypothetical protein